MLLSCHQRLSLKCYRELSYNPILHLNTTFERYFNYLSYDISQGNPSDRANKLRWVHFHKIMIWILDLYGVFCICPFSTADSSVLGVTWERCLFFIYLTSVCTKCIYLFTSRVFVQSVYICLRHECLYKVSMFVYITSVCINCRYLFTSRVFV